MRTLLGVKWKLILAVIGVSLVSLIGLLLMNLHEAHQYTLAGSRTLLREAASLEASRYIQAAEAMSTVIDAVNVLLQVELDHSAQENEPANIERVAVFTQSTLERSAHYLKGLGMIVQAGLFDDPTSDKRFSGPGGFTTFEYSLSPGYVEFNGADELEIEVNDAWWTSVRANRIGFIGKPYLDDHVSPGGSGKHAETRFVRPIEYGGNIVGVIWAEMCLSDYRVELTSIEAANRIAYGVLVSPDGATVGKPARFDASDVIHPSDSELSSLNTERHPEIMAAVQEGKPLEKTLELGPDRLRVQVTTAPIRTRGVSRQWSVLMLRREDSALSGYAGTLSRFFRQGLIMLLVSGLLGYLVSRFMGRNILANEEWHRTILDRVPLPLGILDAESKWAYANPEILKVLEIPNQEALAGKTARETMPARHAEFVARTNTPEAADIEKLEVTVHGSRIHTLSSCRLVDTDGKYIGRLIIGVDVTDARRIAKTLVMATSIARSLDGKSEGILRAAQTLSDLAMQKSAAIEEITSTTQRIGESSSTYAESARNSFSQAEATHQASDRGAAEAQEAAQAMTGVRDSGQKIRSVIKLIDDIAFQTNLLALNAAVEAARAGRNGKGFAVVAGEVRNLASRSARAAKETAAMIEEMTDRIGGATGSIEQLVGTLGDISSTADILRDNSNEVARLADEQSNAVHQVHISLEEISKSVNSTITVSQETASVAESIMQQAASLRQVTETGDEQYLRPPTKRRARPEQAAEPISRNQLPDGGGKLFLPHNGAHNGAHDGADSFESF